MAMRAIRCLRPLRAISRFPSVQVAVLCLIESVPLMARVARPVLLRDSLVILKGREGIPL